MFRPEQQFTSSWLRSYPASPIVPSVRYAVYDPKDPRKAELMRDPVLGQIVLGQGRTITEALAAARAPSGSVVWDRQERRIAYTVP
jgi:hypothetical protein